MMKFGNRKVYLVPGTNHQFRTEHDAKFYCEQNGIDYNTVEIYDSQKELDRWRELQMLERAGEISELRRQVEYRILDGYKRRIPDGESRVLLWCVGGHPFGKKSQAQDYCRRNGWPMKKIARFETKFPRYKTQTVFRPAHYTADFVYEMDGETVVEDVKSVATRKEADYRLRIHLMWEKHGILVKEVL
jgi:hypothetical protein